jgi:ribosomal protein S27AE
LPTRLTWRGNLRAQEEADRAFAKLRPKVKPKKKKKPKGRRSHKPVEYHKYIVSRKWKAKRAKFVAAKEGRCERCGSGKFIQVHHKHYRPCMRCYNAGNCLLERTRNEDDR